MAAERVREHLLVLIGLRAESGAKLARVAGPGSFRRSWRDSGKQINAP